MKFKNVNWQQSISISLCQAIHYWPKLAIICIACQSWTGLLINSIMHWYIDVWNNNALASIIFLYKLLHLVTYRVIILCMRVKILWQFWMEHAARIIISYGLWRCAVKVSQRAKGSSSICTTSLEVCNAIKSGAQFVGVIIIQRKQGREFVSF